MRVTTRPSADLSNDFTLVGGASAHAVLSDDSDASYLELTGTGDLSASCSVQFATPSIPAGAMAKQDRLRLRLARITGSQPFELQIDAGGGFGPPPGPGGDDLNANWASPTTIVAAKFTDGDTAAITPQASVDGAFHGAAFFVAAAGRIYEAYWDTIYVEQPTVDSVSVSPSTPISDDDTPRISWTETLDPDGGDQAFFQVRVFTDAVYGAGGFNPATSVAASASGAVGTTARAWTIADRLDDDTYRAYTRVGQLVNGTVLWSDWEFVQFVLAVDRPAVPTINAISEDSDNARIEIHLGITVGGDVSTDAFQIERSTDGGTTWEIIRVVGNLLGLIEPGDIAYDYEVPNSQAVRYQVRSFHNFPSGTTSSSDWLESDPVFWASSATWIKHSTRPDLNLASEIYSQASRGRSAREALVDVLGRENPVPVRDARRSSEGPITFMVEPEDTEAFEDLMDANSTVLIQAPPEVVDWPDRWVSLGDLQSDRYVDKLPVEEGLKSFTWTEVDAPSGDLLAWE